MLNNKFISVESSDYYRAIENKISRLERDISDKRETIQSEYYNSMLIHLIHIFSSKDNYIESKAEEFLKQTYFYECKILEINELKKLLKVLSEVKTNTVIISLEEYKDLEWN